MFTIVHNFKITFPKMLPGFTVFVIPEFKTTIRRNRLVEDCSVLLFLVRYIYRSIDTIIYNRHVLEQKGTINLYPFSVLLGFDKKLCLKRTKGQS